MEGYYKYFSDFECKPKDNLMPKDVKRIFSHCDHKFNKRYYFISESEKIIYRFYPNDNGGAVLETYSNNVINKKSPCFYLIPDDKETRDVIAITDNLLKRIKNMNKIILERIKPKK